MYISVETSASRYRIVKISAEIKRNTRHCMFCFNLHCVTVIDTLLPYVVSFGLMLILPNVFKIWCDKYCVLNFGYSGGHTAAVQPLSQKLATDTRCE